jgi:hypothetical protein
LSRYQDERVDSRVFSSDHVRRLCHRVDYVSVLKQHRRHVPSLSILGNDRNGLAIVFDQDTDHGRATVRLKGNAVANAEFEHPVVGAELVQHPQPLDNTVIEVNKFRFTELVDVDVQRFLQSWWTTNALVTFPNLFQSAESVTVLFLRSLDATIQFR